MYDMIRQLLSVVNLVAEPSVVADTGVVGLKTDVSFFSEGELSFTLHDFAGAVTLPEKWE